VWTNTRPSAFVFRMTDRHGKSEHCTQSERNRKTRVPTRCIFKSFPFGFIRSFGFCCWNRSLTISDTTGGCCSMYKNSLTFPKMKGLPPASVNNDRKAFFSIWFRNADDRTAENSARVARKNELEFCTRKNMIIFYAQYRFSICAEFVYYYAYTTAEFGESSTYIYRAVYRGDPTNGTTEHVVLR